MTNQDMEYFKKTIETRLKDIRSKMVCPKPIAKLITPNDLEVIYRHLFDFEEDINKVPLGGAIRLAKGSIDKENNIPPRTLAITRDLEGNYNLILETKSKLATGHKKTTKVFTGGYKKGKPSWRIDTEVPEPYISMVTYVVLDAEQMSVLKEDQVHKLFKNHSENVNYSFMTDYNAPSKKFNNAIILKVCQYSPLASDNLEKIINKYELTQEEKNHIRYQLLKGLEVLHDLNVAHQDLKAPNILVYLPKDSDSQFDIKIKITDFGISAQHQSEEIPFATLQYESPEISLIHDDDKQKFIQSGKLVSFKEYYNNNRFHSLGRDYRGVIKALASSSTAHQSMLSYTEEQIASFKKPDKANDMWSLGILLHYLEYGFIPTIDNNQIHKDPLLKALLDPNRETRIDIKKAIALHDSLTLKSPIRDSPATLPESPTSETPITELRHLFASKQREPINSEPQVKIEVPILVKSEFVLEGKYNATEQVILHHALRNQLKDAIQSFQKFSQHPEYDPSAKHIPFKQLMLQLTQFEEDVSKIDLRSPNLARTLKQKLKQVKEIMEEFEKQVPTVHFNDPFKSTHNQICSLQRNLEGWSRQYKSPVANNIKNTPNQEASPTVENKKTDVQNQFVTKNDQAKQKEELPTPLGNSATGAMSSETTYLPSFVQTGVKQSRVSVNVANEKRRGNPKI